MVRQEYPAVRDTKGIVATELSRNEWSSRRLFHFWTNRRRRIPRSRDSELELPGLFHKTTFV